MKTDKQIAITSKEIAETLIKEYDSEDMDSISNGVFKFQTEFHDRTWHFCPNFGQI